LQNQVRDFNSLARKQLCGWITIGFVDFDLFSLGIDHVCCVLVASVSRRHRKARSDDRRCIVIDADRERPLGLRGANATGGSIEFGHLSQIIIEKWQLFEDRAIPTFAEAANGRTRKDPSLYCAQPRACAERIPARLHCRLESCCGPLMWLRQRRLSVARRANRNRGVSVQGE
jgi:hypothetical protein